LGRQDSPRAQRSRFTRIEARRELAVSGDPGGLAHLIRENASALTFLGLGLGVFVSRKFFIVPVGVAAMLLQDYVRDYLSPAPGRRVRRRRRHGALLRGSRS